MFLDPRGVKQIINFQKVLKLHNSLLTYLWPPLGMLLPPSHPVAKSRQRTITEFSDLLLIGFSSYFQSCSCIFDLRLILISLSRPLVLFRTLAKSYHCLLLLSTALSGMPPHNYDPLNPVATHMLDQGP